MPVVGLGTGLITEQDMVTSTLTTAIMAGYRLIDTADSYNNHRQIAAALKVILPSQGLSRTDMFITTKIHPTDLGYLNCRKSVNRFLEELSTSYLDLVLIHAPSTTHDLIKQEKQKRLDTWRCLQEFYEEGLVKSIGVSNFDKKEIQELLDIGGTRPQVNQVLMTPYNPQVSILSTGLKKNTVLQYITNFNKHKICAKVRKIIQSQDF